MSAETPPPPPSSPEVMPPSLRAPPPPPPPPSTLIGRILHAVRGETAQLQPRFRAVSLASRLLPPQVANRVRTALLRRAGFRIGDDTVVCGTPSITGGGDLAASHLRIGQGCVIDVGCSFELGAPIRIGDRVTIGHQVMILTSTHELGPREHRCGPLTRSPVIVRDGAWLGPRCIILPGVTIGEGAIVAPGSLVNKDVEPHTRVSGVPARKVEALPT